jgi:Fe-S cluster assembly scaffold protein SufB
MKTIDILKSKDTVKIEKGHDYVLTPNLLKSISLKKTISFEINDSNIQSKIIYKCMAQRDTNIDLTITVKSKSMGIKNVKIRLEIHILNTSRDNNIKIQPFLEIPNREIAFEHKVTIGAPDKKWLKYLHSRGIKRQEAIKLLSQNFITGHQNACKL